MSEQQDDARFPDWKPDDRTQKSTILYHMNYAHEAQAKDGGIEWWGFNVEYWKRKYSRQELLDIHRSYHGLTNEPWLVFKDDDILSTINNLIEGGVIKVPEDFKAENHVQAIRSGLYTDGITSHVNEWLADQVLDHLHEAELITS